MVRPYEEGGNRLGAEVGQTGVLKVKENIAERVTGSAVAVGDDRLNSFQFRNAWICLFEIERRQDRLGRGTNAEIVLQEQHFGDLADIRGILLFQTGDIIRRTKEKAPKLNGIGSF